MFGVTNSGRDREDVTAAAPTSAARRPSAGEEVSNWNVPNVLTSLRILFIPVFAWLVLTGHDWWGFAVFVLLMATDKLDGDIARAKNLAVSYTHLTLPTIYSV